MTCNSVFRKFLITLFFLFMTFDPSQVSSKEIVTKDRIQLAVKEFLGGHNINGYAKIDPLVRMKPCAQALSVLPYREQFKTLVVSCPDLEGWRLILATRTDIDGHSRIKNYERKFLKQQNADSENLVKIKVWVAKRTLRSGTVILPDHIELEIWEGALSQSFQKPNPPFGRKLKRTVTIGKPVRERHLTPHWDVRKGETATLKSNIGSINILTSVIALENAFVGERIKVKNFTSDREMLAYLGEDDVFYIQPLKIFTVSR